MEQNKQAKLTNGELENVAGGFGVKTPRPTSGDTTLTGQRFCPACGLPLNTSDNVTWSCFNTKCSRYLIRMTKEDF